MWQLFLFWFCFSLGFDLLKMDILKNAISDFSFGEFLPYIVTVVRLAFSLVHIQMQTSHRRQKKTHISQQIILIKCIFFSHNQRKKHCSHSNWKVVIDLAQIDWIVWAKFFDFKVHRAIVTHWPLRWCMQFKWQTDNSQIISMFIREKKLKELKKHLSAKQSVRSELCALIE